MLVATYDVHYIAYNTHSIRAYKHNLVERRESEMWGCYENN